MKEKTTLRLEPSQIEKIIFEHYFGSYDEKTKEQITKTFEIEYKVTNKISLISYAKSVKFVLEYYTPIDSLGGAIRKKIILGLNDFNNIINEKISSEGYEIDYLDIESRNDSNDLYDCEESLNYLQYFLKKKEKVKTKKKGWK